MVIELSVGGLVTLLGIPTAITAFCSWMLQRRITKREAAQEEREKAREKNEVLIIKGMGAAIALGEATAEAALRIQIPHQASGAGIGQPLGLQKAPDFFFCVHCASLPFSPSARFQLHGARHLPRIGLQTA